MSDIYAEAQRLVEARISIIPVRPDGSKKPATEWKQYQQRLATPDEIAHWWGNGSQYGIAAIGGEVSGNLLCIDFDDPALVKPWRQIVKSINPTLVDRLVIVKTPSGGYHGWFRTISPVPGNDKLARRQKAGGKETEWETTIETRGSGGFAIIPPSPSYSLIRGDMGDPPLLTDAERDLLLDAARSLNEFVLPERRVESVTQSKTTGGRPGDFYNARGDWEDLLTRHGWKRLYCRGEVEYWQRPGKDDPGASATLHACGPGIFYVFSSNAAPFESERSYDLYGALSTLEHNGDFKSAARFLAGAGYGDQEAASTVQVDPETGEILEPLPAPRRASGITADVLMAKKFDPPRYAVPGLVAEGLTILAGGPKTGKSWMALAFGIAIASPDGMALGSLKVEQGEVLYLALEDTERRLQRRLNKLLKGAPAPPDLHLWTEWDRTNQGGLARLRLWLKDHPRCRLVIVDTFAKIRSPQRTNANLYEDDYQEASALKGVADEACASMLALHHVAKRQTDDPVEAVSGSFGLTGAADATIVLKRQRGKNDGTLYVTGRDVEENEFAIEWSPELGTWTMLGEAGEHRASSERKAIMDAVKGLGGGVTPAQIADELQKKPQNVRYLLSRMVRDGQIRLVGGRYYPPDPNDQQGYEWFRREAS